MAKIFLALASFFKRRYQSASIKVSKVQQRLKEHLVERQLTFAQLVFRSVQFALTRHEILSRASAIAYCAMLAFIPFITLTITIGAHLLPDLGGHSAGVVAASGLTGSAQEVATVIKAIFPADAASLIVDQIARIQQQPPLAVISITLLLALWTSSGLYTEIINALNRIMGVPETRSFWKLRLTSMIMVMLQTAVIFVAFLAIVAWPQIIALAGLSHWMVGVATVVQWLILFAIIYLSFAIVFHFGPDGNRKQHWVSPGSFFGTVVFLVTTYGFRLYLEHFAQYRSAYGSLGGVMMLMFWLWLMSLVLLIATEINKLAGIAEEPK
ncbi:MAG: YihY/virulence factor BrkB family protein [Cyanobacteria bacterium SZAS TMP-1]|nr:YihY/virulence factor BrkB family protein [Cyanobacteria bacterium SZAS TMP-1]